MAGDICNTNVYEADDEATHATVRAMFEEQIAWAVDETADFLIARRSTGAARRRSRST
jgi:betaine-homocysteine S-methyltransferase